MDPDLHIGTGKNCFIRIAEIPTIQPTKKPRKLFALLLLLNKESFCIQKGTENGSAEQEKGKVLSISVLILFSRARKYGSVPDSEFTDTSWDVGEPSGQDEFCVKVVRKPDPSGIPQGDQYVWRTDRCDNETYTLCEFSECESV